MSIEYDWSVSLYSSALRHTTGLSIPSLQASPDEFNLLSFLATAQHLNVEFLPVSWDAGRSLIGSGGTSMINQSLANKYNSLAFKRVHSEDKRTKPEERIFQTLIQELIVLGNRDLAYNSNLVELLGICWDVSTNDGKAWPVFVFEKAQFANLSNFLAHEAGRDLNMNDRLAFILEIGQSILDMHVLNIVHGDIKPENVLVYKNTESTARVGDDGYLAPELTARVADFGYSTRCANESCPLKLPISFPWNAPEHDRLAREWTPAQAKKADIYSYGLLSFWLLFHPWLCGQRSEGHCCPSTASEAQSSSEVALDTLVQLKRNGELQQKAKELMLAEGSLGDRDQAALNDLFATSLSGHPDERELSMQTFLCRYYNRVRCHISRRILEEHTRTGNLGTQAAICYHIGFGCPRDEAKVSEILSLGKVSKEAFESELATCFQVNEVRRPKVLSNLMDAGHLQWEEFAHLWLEEGKLDEAAAQTLQEKQDLDLTLSDNDMLMVMSRRTLVNIYNVQQRWEDAEQLAHEVIAIQKNGLGENHPDILISLGTLASLYRQQERWRDAEELLLEMVEKSGQELGDDHEESLTYALDLALVYERQNRLKEAEELETRVLETRKPALGEDHFSTLVAMDMLCSTLRRQERYEEAVEQGRKAYDISLRTMGREHPATQTAMSNLAVALWSQGCLDEAEGLELELLNAITSQLGEDDPSTIIAMENLASTLWSQGRLQKAEQLERQALQASMRVSGTHHASTLQIAANLASALIEQGRWGEAEDMAVEFAGDEIGIHGQDSYDSLGAMLYMIHVLFVTGHRRHAIAALDGICKGQEKHSGLDDPLGEQLRLVWEDWRKGTPLGEALLLPLAEPPMPAGVLLHSYAKED
ncbi:hypothetical protein N0V82_000620 [Gnomoniopsis sp. IMI 355080]|nr:hypothetical protein N0V82_000620 [Gnomoniopsis sp. IMI 355080]